MSVINWSWRRVIAMWVVGMSVQCAIFFVPFAIYQHSRAGMDRMLAKSQVADARYAVGDSLNQVSLGESEPVNDFETPDGKD